MECSEVRWNLSAQLRTCARVPDIPEFPTVSEFFRANAVTDELVNAAVGAYLADPDATAHPIADDYGLDLAAAVGGRGGASSVVANPESSPSLMRGAIRTPILLASAEGVSLRTIVETSKDSAATIRNGGQEVADLLAQA